MTTIQPHITRADNGTLYVAGTPYKVKHLILEHIAWGLSAIEIRDGHSGLTLGDVHAVLTYFYDNEDAVRQELNDGLRKVDELRAQSPSKVNRQDLLDRLKTVESAGVQQ